MQEEISQLKEKIASLESQLTQMEGINTFIQSLKASTTIPFEVDRAFRDRFRDILTLSVSSSKTADSEDVTVNEGGSSSYAVMNDPVGFLEFTIAGTVYYVPYFNA